MATFKEFVQSTLFDINVIDKMTQTIPAKAEDSMMSDILKIKNHIQKEILKQKRQTIIKFPSINSLVKYLHVTTEELYQAFIELKQTGFDYKMVDTSTPIMFWDNLAITSLSNKK